MSSEIESGSPRTASRNLWSSGMLAVPRWVGAGVAAIAAAAVLSGAGAADPRHRGLLLGTSPAAVLSVLVGLALLVVVPRLWRGARVAKWLVVAGLLGLAALNLIGGLGYRMAVPEACFGLLLATRRAAPEPRLRVSVICAAFGALAVSCWVPLAGALATSVGASRHGQGLHQAAISLSGVEFAPLQLSEDWGLLVDVMIGCAVVLSLLAMRYLAPQVPQAGRHHDYELAAARALVQRHGEDSISPFILRPDKTFHLAAGGVLAYRLIGSTAVVSGDPVGPCNAIREVLASFLGTARARGWTVVFYGASGRHLPAYRSLGLRTMCVGEEAIVEPDRFTLQGRSVRKLRQSVHRVERRDWRISVCDGRDVNAELESEIDALEATWRRERGRVLGFAMGMGTCETGVHARDLYLLARSPSGELRAVMHFISHRGKLSLDTMRRVGETPNGLNEALVCRALEVARERDVGEVSLNYAGLAHLVRNEPGGGFARRHATRLAMALLGRRFQMERLVRFNEKFSPEWRPRFLVYESHAALPRSAYRVLQAEGYLRRPSRRHLRHGELWKQALRSIEQQTAHAFGRSGR